MGRAPPDVVVGGRPMCLAHSLQAALRTARCTGVSEPAAPLPVAAGGAETLTGLSRSTIYVRLDQGSSPLGTRAVGWE